MRVREIVNRHSGIVTGVVVLLLVGAGVFIVRQIRGLDQRTFLTGAYFTTDDGKSWFEDDVKSKPPFLVGGKEAVRAHIFDCDGKPVAGYLERMTAEFKAEVDRADAAMKAGQQADFSKMQGLWLAGTLVKRPGDKDWVNKNSPQGQALTMFKCPNGREGREMLPQ